MHEKVPSELRSHRIAHAASARRQPALLSIPHHTSQTPMASKRPLRALVSTATSSLRPTQASAPSLARASARAFSTTTPSRGPEYDTDAADRPRWQQTPPRMVAPFRTRPLPKGPAFKVNDDPRRLDDAYIRMLGPRGDKLLSDEVKWLAVTHKSFDHGRRGFNDRLAFLGMCETGHPCLDTATALTVVSRTENSLAADIGSSTELAAGGDVAKGRQWPPAA